MADTLRVTMRSVGAGRWHERCRLQMAKAEQNKSCYCYYDFHLLVFRGTLTPIEESNTRNAARTWARACNATQPACDVRQNAILLFVRMILNALEVEPTKVNIAHGGIAYILFRFAVFPFKYFSSICTNSVVRLIHDRQTRNFHATQNSARREHWINVKGIPFLPLIFGSYFDGTQVVENEANASICRRAKHRLWYFTDRGVAEAKDGKNISHDST